MQIKDLQPGFSGDSEVSRLSSLDFIASRNCSNLPLEQWRCNEPWMPRNAIPLDERTRADLTMFRIRKCYRSRIVDESLDWRKTSSLLIPLVTLRLVSGFYTIGFGRWCMVGHRLITQHSYHGELWLHCLKCGRFFSLIAGRDLNYRAILGKFLTLNNQSDNRTTTPPKKKTSQQIATNQRKATQNQPSSFTPIMPAEKPWLLWAGPASIPVG